MKTSTTATLSLPVSLSIRVGEFKFPTARPIIVLEVTAMSQYATGRCDISDMHGAEYVNVARAIEDILVDLGATMAGAIRSNPATLAWMQTEISRILSDRA